jgi:hypothetical protein
MFDIVKNFLQGLKDYRTPVIPNFRPAEKNIVPDEAYANCDRWKGIVIHHSATADGKLNDWENIRHYHMSYRIDGDIVDESTFKSRQMIGSGKSFEKPWSDIGYHGGWEMDNGVFKFKMGRSWNKAGAHAGLKGNNTFNEQYLGLCIVGNFDKAAPTPEQWAFCVKTVKEICAHLGIDKGSVLGHREVYDLAGVPRQKTCPGSQFDIGTFRSQL